MAYVIDSGPGGELLELARRIAAHLGTDAQVAGAATYGGPSCGCRGHADVFIGLQPSSGAGNETWVHARAGVRSRALAQSIRAQLQPARYGSRGGGGSGVPRVGDVAQLAPERHAPNAAACLVEVEPRYGYPSAAVEELARSIAGAVRNTRYGETAAAPPAPAADPSKPFKDLLARAAADPPYRASVLENPLASLAALGITVPPELETAMVTQVRNLVAGPTASGQGLEDENRLEQYPWGFVIYLDNVNTNKMCADGGNIADALAFIALIDPELLSKLISASIVFMLKQQLGQIRAANRGRGVKLTFFWLVFVPGAVGWVNIESR